MSEVREYVSKLNPEQLKQLNGLLKLVDIIKQSEKERIFAALLSDEVVEEACFEYSSFQSIYAESAMKAALTAAIAKLSEGE